MHTIKQLCSYYINMLILLICDFLAFKSIDVHTINVTLAKEQVVRESICREYNFVIIFILGL